MTNLVEGVSNQILLLAPTLLGESLAKQLSLVQPDLDVFLKREDLTRQPCMVIWSVESLEVRSSIQLELRRLQENWKPAPVILLLPAKHTLKTNELLQFDCPGLLQDPDLETLKEAIKIIRGGGRIVRLKEQESNSFYSNESTMGLGQWILLSGIQQINKELIKIDLILSKARENSFKELLLLSRKRELKAAKSLIYWIWGPLELKLDNLDSSNDSLTKSISGIGATGFPLQEEIYTNISLEKRDSIAVWEAIKLRLDKSIKEGVINSTGELLAIEGLSQSRQEGLFISILDQIDQVLKRLRKANQNQSKDLIKENWDVIQPEIRQEALRRMAGSYIRLPFKGKLATVSEQLIKMTNLSDTDDELPLPNLMLDPLLMNKPLVVDGQLLPSDDPRALMQLEMFISNWLIRTAELIVEEIISVCGEWPELRRYLLKPHLVSTRELERLRNHLNSKNRWQNLVRRPIQLYESKRLFYRIKQGRIEPVLMTEPRDEELKALNWLQQQVALLVEARDAIAPQIQTIIRKFGDLMVVILTQVIGRAIGLVGRGIAQGMGRSLGRS
ncbi:DUF3685 domain-containing protein [Prochlorococcus sp. MIT 1307]|uniref:DUF3685 domain-containing protein n=1 Tax=Prochlorococcus sp. MIT 1307 TaxID=3096219 RepID=UPI002A747C65|nr:DUF3685 domain-containing protein [Prochlorococcus sp. MIT 1307]